MMKKKALILTVSAGIALSGPVHVFAAESTQDLLISKLTQVQLGLAPSDPARVGVLLRLADLHAERARQLSMKELAENCVVCKAGDADRKKALTFYTEALGQLPANAQAKVQLQMGHLYELQGDSHKAEQSYKAMLAGTGSAVDKAEASLSLAEMAFRNSEFAKAEGLYAQVLATDGASSQGLAAYRKAWSAFRLGNLNGALVQLQEIMKNPKLQSRMASSRGVADVQFLEEVSRDMATFMAARGTQDGDAQLLFDVTPETFRVQQVTLLARETTRLDQKEAALKTWNFVYQKQQDAKARLESLVRMAQLEFDLKRVEPAAQNYQKALALWSTAQCSMESCEESGKALRQFVISWNRLETAKPSAGLLAAYQEYLNVFSQDEDMYIWGAQAATAAGDGAKAQAWTQMASQLLVTRYQTASAQDKTMTAQKLEKNLLLSIELAEKSKDEAQLQQAQNDYLKLSVLQDKAVDVQYQKAYAIYQKGQYGEAATQLRELALLEKAPTQIRTQAAELSLDALALLKDDARMQAWSTDFAQKFPAKKAEFMTLQQKAVLNQSAQVAADNPAQALAALSQFNAAQASPEDRKTYLKNKIILNEKLNKITEARVAAEDLLREPTLTAQEKEFTLGRKLWFAELELDFATALATAQQMKFEGLSAENKMLKLALYADLANKNPEQYYQQYLRQSQDGEKKALIAMQLIRSSKNGAKDLETYKPYFKNQNGLYARAALQVYGSTQDRKVLEKVAKDKGSSQDAAFVMIEKILLLGDIKNLQSTLAGQKLDTKSQGTIAKSLKARIQSLDKLDTVANRAIATGDWASQLLALDLVAKENSRFYQEAIALPMPAGLTPEQENEYLTILSQQVTPNQTTATLAETKVKEFWSRTEALQDYKKFVSQNNEWAPFLIEEMTAVATIAPADSAAAWNTAVAEVKSAQGQTGAPSLAELEKARLNLKQNPFAVSAIEGALALEKKAQRRSMVEYLEGRLASLPKESAGSQQ